jgi:hypothetical protein
VDGTDSGSCPEAGFCISGVELPGSASRESLWFAVFVINNMVLEFSACQLQAF